MERRIKEDESAIIPTLSQEQMIGFGERVRQLRKDLKYTQEYLAGILDISKWSISQIERGKKLPIAETLNRLAKILRVDVRYLLEGEECLSSNLEYWTKVVSNAQKVANAGKYLDIIAPMLKQAFEIIETARLNDKVMPNTSSVMAMNAGHHNQNNLNIGARGTI